MFGTFVPALISRATRGPKHPVITRAPPAKLTAQGYTAALHEPISRIIAYGAFFYLWNRGLTFVLDDNVFHS